jgi:hypothetical protein
MNKPKKKVLAKHRKKRKKAKEKLKALRLEKNKQA